ncbi:hypothetical protein Pint_06535 [Pistacia integerrima]|uniref:Uncharacterized protein n=1 Tax=Pistacia integerrima TaxID=434235 RepID=A0ACC0Z2X9_9ROSI|nr:hypothetical protein Pint_06535 [Pistacia integerrima]
MMLTYHLFLLYRYLNLPETTALGFDNHNRRAWVGRIVLNRNKDMIGAAVSVISSQITTATVLSTISILLSSLIGAWLGSSSNNVFQSNFILGDTRPTTMSIKYISLLVCFLLAFSCFVTSISYSVHANYLISMPGSNIPLEFVETAVIKGSEFWSLGLRAFCFALNSLLWFLGLRALCFAYNLLLWFFGPIPMFISSIALVIILHHFGINQTPLHHDSSP